MKKELLKSMLLIVCLLSSITASADSFESEGIYYNITSQKEKTVEVTFNSKEYDLYSGDVVIPQSVKQGETTYSVTKIGESAFFYCSNLTSITIPNSVTEIGEYAFASCTSLKNISIPNSLTEVGYGIFDDTPWLENQPDGLIYAGLVAYKYKGKMPNGTSITIKEGTKMIAEEAFTYCFGLTSVVIPKSVIKIGREAFYGCTNSSINIPKSVIEIGRDALTDTPWFENQPDGLVYAGLVAYKYKGEMPNGTSITIKDGTKMISEDAFSNCSGMTSIVIPNSVTKIGWSPFERCSSLTNVTIPNSITEIEFIFQNCSGLTSVTIPNSVTVIGLGAFCNCTGLTSVTIPNSVTEIGNEAFDGCSSLQNITIPDSVTEIGEKAFNFCLGLTSVTIPNSVTKIGREAFFGCSGLESITIPNSVTEIGKNTFRSCTNLTSVTIPNSVTEIGAEAFYGCTGLTSITIPNSVTEIGYNAFKDCTGLKEIYNYSESPRLIIFDIFQGVDTQTCILYVPEGTVEAYRASDCWKEFLNIKEFKP